jgi:surfeit locus 1 family protein
LLLLAAGFVALGVWQVERRAWKHDLIAMVEARIHQPPVDAPGPEAWPGVTAARDAYTRVRFTGHYLPGRDTLVRAVSDYGAGYWVTSPFDTGRFTLLVNRGFVPQGQAAPPPPAGAVAVTGLLRITEPKGGFLRANDPGKKRWYSRDVIAIAAAQGFHGIAPYFVDAAAAPGGGYPIGGLTMVRFSDNHLVYALTWFGMALLSLGFAWRLAVRRTAN